MKKNNLAILIMCSLIAFIVGSAMGVVLFTPDSYETLTYFKHVVVMLVTLCTSLLFCAAALIVLCLKIEDKDETNKTSN